MRNALNEIERLTQLRWGMLLGWGRLAELAGVAAAMGMAWCGRQSDRAHLRRERRLREELEAYDRLDAPPVKDVDLVQLGREVCRAVAEKSAFHRVALLVWDAEGRLYVAAKEGMDDATAWAVQNCARQMAGAEQTVRAGAVREMCRAGTRIGNRGFAVVLRQDEGDIGFGRAIILPLRSSEGTVLGVLAVCADGMLSIPRRKVEEALLPLESLAGKLESRLQAALRIRKKVDALLEFWRPQVRRDESVDVSELLREVAGRCRETIEMKRVRLVVQAGPEATVVRGSRDRLRQVMEHLLNNAAEAIAAAERLWPGEERAIWLTVSGAGELVYGMASDTGPGFRDPARAFEPLGERLYPDGGAGMGLLICNEIVHEHGGEISAFNLHPHGAAVVFELPAADFVQEKSKRGAEASACAASVWG